MNNQSSMLIYLKYGLYADLYLLTGLNTMNEKMGKTAFITGGARRIGREICLKLAEMNYDIVFTYLSSQKEAETLKLQINSMGRRCSIKQFDLTETEKIPQLMAEIFEEFSGLDLIVNNASIFERRSFKETSLEQLDKNFSLHFKTPFMIVREFANFVNSGQVINILDTRITKKKSAYFAYLLSKKALSDFTLMAASELAPGIRVNGVAPGLILPPDGLDSGYLDRLAEKIPAARKGDVSDILNSIEFLIKNEYITGQIIFNDGGEHLI
jgi:NAD(P)-dependent dehydrogenase (short-subunit alcohol dehydrogenase family)